MSIWLEPAIYQYEFMDDKIAVARWDKIPKSTTQWAVVNCTGRFRFEGTCNDDLRVVEEPEENAS